MEGPNDGSSQNLAGSGNLDALLSQESGKLEVVHPPGGERHVVGTRPANRAPVQSRATHRFPNFLGIDYPHASGHPHINPKPHTPCPAVSSRCHVYHLVKLRQAIRFIGIGALDHQQQVGVLGHQFVFLSQGLGRFDILSQSHLSGCQQASQHIVLGNLQSWSGCTLPVQCQHRSFGQSLRCAHKQVHGFSAGNAFGYGAGPKAVPRNLPFRFNRQGQAHALHHTLNGLGHVFALPHQLARTTGGHRHFSQHAFVWRAAHSQRIHAVAAGLGRVNQSLCFPDISVGN